MSVVPKYRLFAVLQVSFSKYMFTNGSFNIIYYLFNTYLIIHDSIKCLIVVIKTKMFVFI